MIPPFASAPTFVTTGELPTVVRESLDQLAREGRIRIVEEALADATDRTIHLWPDRPTMRRGFDVVVYEGRPPRWAIAWLEQPGTALLRVAENIEDQRRLLLQLAGQVAEPHPPTSPG